MVEIYNGLALMTVRDVAGNLPCGSITVATVSTVLVDHQTFDYDPSQSVTLKVQTESNSSSGTLVPAEEYKVTLVNAENEAISVLLRDWTALNSTDLTFNLPATSGTWFLVVHLRRTTGVLDWEANSRTGIVSGGGNATVFENTMGRVRTSLNVSAFTVVKPDGSAIPGGALYYNDQGQVRITPDQGANGGGMTATVRQSKLIDRTRSLTWPTVAARQDLTFDVGQSAYDDAPETVDVVVEVIEESAGATNHSLVAGAPAGQASSWAFTVFKSTSVGYVDYQTLTLVGAFTADSSVSLSSDGVTPNGMMKVKTQPRVLRLFNRGESLGTPGTEAAVWVLNGANQPVAVSVASAEIQRIVGSSPEGAVATAWTGTRLDITYTVPTTSAASLSTIDSGDEKQLLLALNDHAVSDGWAPANLAEVNLETVPGGAFEVTSKLAVTFDARTSRDFATYDPSTRKTRFVIAGPAAYMLGRVQDCQDRGVDAATFAFSLTDADGIAAGSFNLTTNLDGYAEADAGAAGNQGTRVDVETPSGVWTWSATCTSDGNTGSDVQSVDYVSPFTGDVLALLQFPLRHEPGSRLRVWASFGKVDSETLEASWADGADLAVDDLPRYSIYTFDPDAPRQVVVENQAMTAKSGQVAGGPDYFLDITPTQRRTYLLIAWGTMNGQLLTMKGQVRVDVDGSVLGETFGTDRARGVRFVSARGDVDNDVDEAVVTDKTIASKESASASADAILGELGEDEQETVVTRIGDDRPYERGDWFSLPELGVEGTIVEVERKGSDVRLTLGREPYKVGGAEARTAARIEKEERA